MGIMTITHVDDLDRINRKTLNKMKTGKQRDVQHLIIQEGVPSQVRYHQAVAEPVIYCIGDTFIGSFLRVNQLRDELSNLNAKGMEFIRLCEQDDHPQDLPSECCGDRFMTDWSCIASKLSLLAAAMENSQTI